MSMKILNTQFFCSPNVSTNYRLQSKSNTNIINNQDIVSFGSFNNKFVKLTAVQKMIFNIQKLVSRINGKADNASSFDLSFFEGAQKGIKVFDGLSLPDIAFMGDNLQVIAAKQGCYSKCIHCYAQAQKPLAVRNDTVNAILFEDFKSLVEGYKTLKNRTGLDFFADHNAYSHNALVYDADNIDIASKDLNGNIHEFPEFANLLFNTLNKKCVFDTSGWNPANLKYQQRANRICEYYSKNGNFDELYQFNISINPFHSIYVKSLELKETGNSELSQKLYETYVNRISNAIFTFLPLIKNEKFGLIIRAFSDDIAFTDGMNVSAVNKILDDIYNNLLHRCKIDMISAKKKVCCQKELDDIAENIKRLMSDVDTGIIYNDNLDKFLHINDSNCVNRDFARMIMQRDFAKDVYQSIKSKKSIKNINKYYKITDVTGRVYLCDNYRVIPTDLQFNFINKNKQADTFHPLVEKLNV